MESNRTRLEEIGSPDIATCDQVKTERDKTEVEIALEELAIRISQANQMLLTINERLVLVLAPPRPAEQAETKEANPCSCPLAAEIWDRSQEINQMSSEYKDILDRLQL